MTTGLLELARSQLDAAEPQASRMACWLGRTAMETILGDLLAARNLHPGEQASTRALLTCLEVAYEDQPDLVARAGYAWAQLSEACHHHAYRLSPTHSEAEHLLNLVGSLEEATWNTP